MGGKEKKFREGQKVQTLDNLVFVYINTVAKLRPKVAILENVEGLLLGNAWRYVKKIYEMFHKIGYSVRHELLKGEDMGVPQIRHRVFFIATRLDFDLQKINLNFYYEPITYKDIKEGIGHTIRKDCATYEIMSNARDTDKSLADTRVRMGQKGSAFQTYYIRPHNIMWTLRSKLDVIDLEHKSYISKETIRNASTFPQDYDFGSNAFNTVGYICGMSVPPLMIKRLVTRIIESGIFKEMI